MVFSVQSDGWWPNPVLSTQSSQGQGSVAQWTQPTLTESHEDRSSSSKWFDHSGADPYDDLCLMHRCIDLPGATGPDNELPHPAHVFDIYQRSAAQHHEEHSRQKSPCDMPNYGEKETQDSVHGQPEGPAQPKTVKRKRPLLSDKERAQIPKRILELLDKAPNEELSQCEREEMQQYITSTLNDRQSQRRKVAQKQDLGPSQPRVGERLKELNSRARGGKEILEEDINGFRYFITPTPAQMSLPVGLANEKQNEIAAFTKGYFHVEPPQKRDKWLKNSLYRLKSHPNRVAKQQNLLAAAQQNSETASPSGAGGEELKIYDFKSHNIKKAKTSGKTAQGVHRSFRYFFTPTGSSVSLPDRQAGKFSQELGRIVKWYDKGISSEKDFVREITNTKRVAGRVEEGTKLAGEEEEHS